MEPIGLQLFLGPDRPRKLQRIQELERTLQVSTLDRHYVDSRSVDADELIGLCRQQPALSRLRLIVIDEAHHLSAAASEGLLRHAAVIAQAACAVLLADREMSLKHPLAQAAHEGSVQVVRFAGREAPAAKPFALVEALGARDVTAALQAVRDQINIGKEPLELVGLVAWQLQRWVLVRRLWEAGHSTERIAASAGMHAWQVERIRSEVTARPLASLRHLLQRCWCADVDAKSGRIGSLLVVEQLVLEVCTA